MKTVLTRYSHFVKIETHEQRLIDFINLFVSLFYTLRTPGQSRDKQEASDKEFASHTTDLSAYWFLVPQFYQLMNFLQEKGYSKDDFTLVKEPMFEPKIINHSVREIFKPKDNQQEVIDYLTDSDYNCKLVPLQTGKGKTFCALSAISDISLRTVIIVLPMYMEKWTADVQEVLVSDQQDTMVVRGSKHLMGLIDLAKNNQLTSSFIIISSRTMQNYIKEYEEDKILGEEMYGCSPDDFFKTLQAGCLLIDETHQHLHFVYKLFTHTHVPRIIGLTATLITDSHVIKRVHEIMYPNSKRFPETAYDRYANVYSISYNFTKDNIKRIKTSEWGRTSYSHNAFEKSILRDIGLTNAYLNLIHTLVEVNYMDSMVSGDKAAIYVSTVEMATKATAYLSMLYPQLDVRRYCEDDPFENVMDPDIRVTTVISAGTAIDIKGLTTVILTINLSSSAANLQVIGRLRKIKDRDLRFCYIWSPQLDKHRDYNRQKLELLKDKALQIFEVRSSVDV